MRAANYARGRALDGPIHRLILRFRDRRSGGIVIFGSGAGLAGSPNTVAYSASKAFDMVFAEAVWAELHDKGATSWASSWARPIRPHCVRSNTAAAG
jgi:NADP-dependent 3-hydroxy acid dehydrogenase YdfG